MQVDLDPRLAQAYVRRCIGRPNSQEKSLRELRRIRLYISVKIALDHQCPVCGSRDLRQSRRTGLLTAVLRRLSIEIGRCRQCHHHFLLPRTEQKRDRQRLSTTAAAH